MSITGSRTKLALAQQGYMPAMRRPRCATCAHIRPADNPSCVDQCKKGGFMVTRWSVCNDHELKKREPS